MSTVLIVDDEIDIQSALSFALKDEGYDVLTASSPAEAEKILEEVPVDLGLFDVWFPDGDGMELLKTARQRFPRSTIIMMSGHGNIELALNALRIGAYDFLEKPLELEKVLVTLRNASESQILRQQNQRLLHQLLGNGELIGSSQAVSAARDVAQKAAHSNSHVLIRGENGSGKELVARLIHQMSERHDKPFIKVNCAAIPEGELEKELFGVERGALRAEDPQIAGCFEQAGGGTVFLDEISELSLAVQSKLLRVLEDRAYQRVGGHQVLRTEVRVLAATTRDLPREIQEGRFREDLYFRLNGLSFLMPPLRERREDLPLLAGHFLECLAKENGRFVPRLEETLLKWMQGYDWPGNVRELRNLLERMLMMGSGQVALGLANLPEELQSWGSSPKPFAAASLEESFARGSLREWKARFEKTLLEKRWVNCGKDIGKTAASLELDPLSLRRKLRQYGIPGSEA